MQFEWICHNLAYGFYSLIGNEEKSLSAQDLDVGPTIFNDEGHNFKSKAMKYLYVTSTPNPIWSNDLKVYLENRK